MPGESSPPTIMMAEASSWALFMTVLMTLPTPKTISGMTSVGMMIMDISVRRSRSESFSSLR